MICISLQLPSKEGVFINDQYNTVAGTPRNTPLLRPHYVTEPLTLQHIACPPCRLFSTPLQYSSPPTAYISTHRLIYFHPLMDNDHPERSPKMLWHSGDFLRRTWTDSIAPNLPPAMASLNPSIAFADPRCEDPRRGLPGAPRKLPPPGSPKYNM